MNETIKNIIIDVLDIKPSEYTQRFKGGDLKNLDKEIYEIASKCYETGRKYSGLSVGSVSVTPINTPNNKLNYLHDDITLC